MSLLHPIPPYEWTSRNAFFGCLPFCQRFVKEFFFYWQSEDYEAEDRKAYPSELQIGEPEAKELEK